jgi:hypothetical protein
MSLSKAMLEPVIDRIMRTWSLIRMMPEGHLSEARASVSALLGENSELSENELLVIGFRHLHQIWDASREAVSSAE